MIAECSHVHNVDMDKACSFDKRVSTSGHENGGRN